MPTLNERVALVTGAARRTGRAIAVALAQAGSDVVVHYRSNRDEAEATAAFRKYRPHGRLLKINGQPVNENGTTPAEREESP